MLIPATLKDLENKPTRVFVYVMPDGKEVKARVDKFERNKGETTAFLMLGKDDFSTKYVSFDEKTGVQKSPVKLFVRSSDKYGIRVTGKQLEAQKNLPPGLMKEITKYGGRKQTRRRRRTLTNKKKE